MGPFRLIDAPGRPKGGVGMVSRGTLSLLALHNTCFASPQSSSRPQRRRIHYIRMDFSASPPLEDGKELVCLMPQENEKKKNIVFK